MSARIDIGQATPQNGNRMSFRRKCCAMADAINAKGQPAGDGKPAVHQTGGKVIAPVLTVVAKLATADHGDLRLLHRFRVAFDQQQQGCIVDMKQLLWIAALTIDPQKMAWLFQPGKRGGQITWIRLAKLRLLPGVQSQFMQQARRFSAGPDQLPYYLAGLQRAKPSDPAHP
ncbi:hypothetical protein SLIQ_24675 [Serratia liquefaciens FK01]|nr:hypothetical protein SLIQ_24675 [Serratia liquefaciens FK01]